MLPNISKPPTDSSPLSIIPVLTANSASDDVFRLIGLAVLPLSYSQSFLQRYKILASYGFIINKYLQLCAAVALRRSWAGEMRDMALPAARRRKGPAVMAAKVERVWAITSARGANSGKGVGAPAL